MLALGAGGLLALCLGLAVRWSAAVAFAIGVLGAEQAVRLADGPDALDRWTPLYAGAFLLLAELAWWSLEPRVAAWTERDAALRRLATVLLICAAGSLFSAVVVIAAGAPIHGGFGLELAGVLAATAASLAAVVRCGSLRSEPASGRGFVGVMAQVLPAERDLRRVIGDGDDIPDGEVDGLAEQDLLELYRSLVLLRTYDERSVVYHRQGRIGTYAIFWNHEAMQAGSVHALEREDWIFPSYRESAIGLLRGMPRVDGALVVARPSGRLVEPGRLQRRLDLRADRDARAARGRARVGQEAARRARRARSRTSATARPPRARSTRARTSPP